MGSCCSKDLDSKTSWSPADTKNASLASTVVAQPTNEDTATGVFTQTTLTRTMSATNEDHETRTVTLTKKIEGTKNEDGTTTVTVTRHIEGTISAE